LSQQAFRFDQARLGIAIGPTPEMAEIEKSFISLALCPTAFTPKAMAEKLSKDYQNLISKRQRKIATT
jgi:hypothetical protein